MKNYNEYAKEGEFCAIQVYWWYDNTNTLHCVHDNNPNEFKERMNRLKISMGNVIAGFRINKLK